MEESRKKTIMIGVVVVCLAAAAVITYINIPRSSGDTSNIPADATVWLKCRNPACEEAYEMNKREYDKQVMEETREAGDSMSMELPPIRCEKCGEYSAYLAVKCEKCGLVFERNSVLDDLPDRCPECGYSKMEEESRK